MSTRHKTPKPARKTEQPRMSVRRQIASRKLVRAKPADDDTTADDIYVVADRWDYSVDSLDRLAAEGKLRITVLGPRKRVIVRSEQKRFIKACSNELTVDGNA